MRLTYLGPLTLGIDHPAMGAIDCAGLPGSCFAAEAGCEAGIDGDVIEGDLLLIDERRTPHHGDLVAIEADGRLCLRRAHRIGGGFYLVPLAGGGGTMANRRMLRGVVVALERVTVPA